MQSGFVLQLFFLLGFPLLTQTRLHNKWLSPVVLAYATGLIIAALLPGKINTSLASGLSEVSILIAIPLLLFGTQLNKLREKTGKALLAFGLCVGSGFLVSLFAGLYFHETFPESNRVSAMLVGLYTGGTPNMQAIGMGLGVPDETIIMVNAADVLSGGLYLLILTSFGPWLFGKILPVHPPLRGEVQVLTEEPFRFRDASRAFVLSLIIVLISVGSILLITGSLEKVSWIILILTSLGIMASRNKTVQSWKGIYPLASYFLLVFCLALGTLADFRHIAAQGGPVISLTFVVMIATILLHLLLSRIWKIDRDTFMITSTAALFGPAFIGQIAGVLKNPGIIVQGMFTGLLGYALGNYLGFLLYWLSGLFL